MIFLNDKSSSTATRMNQVCRSRGWVGGGRGESVDVKAYNNYKEQGHANRLEDEKDPDRRRKNYPTSSSKNKNKNARTYANHPMINMLAPNLKDTRKIKW